MKIYEGKNVHIRSWCNNPEKGVLEQAQNLAALPFISKHVCLMPDTHQGYGMPIGGVIACDKVVIPNAVGSDVGCGMCAAQTTLTSIDTDTLKKIMGDIRECIPVGFNRHEVEQDWDNFEFAPDIPIVQRELDSARKQLGTLGGGNHFIEIQKEDDGYVWIMIHSGSRNFGYKIAKAYNKIAQKLCRQWYSDIPLLKGDDGLAFLPIETKEAKEYMRAMDFALEFAEESRQRMMDEVIRIISRHTTITLVSVMKVVDIHHNYAQWENHFGKNVIVHRKGATSAKEGEIGIIPGSQGTASYIVKGKGNKDSFMSCSHGAGRKMSRTKARNTLDLQEEINKLDAVGVLHGLNDIQALDEASSAYKDIQIVMEEQSDLVEIVAKLKPLAVIKA